MKNYLLFIGCPILFTSIGEFFLKASINKLNDLDSLVDLMVAMMNPQIALGFSLVLLGGLLWLVGLSKFELSFIYPFLSINYVIIILGSWLLLGEPLSGFKLLALALISAGLFVISRTPYTEAEHLD